MLWQPFCSNRCLSPLVQILWCDVPGYWFRFHLPKWLQYIEKFHILLLFLTTKVICGNLREDIICNFRCYFLSLLNLFIECCIHRLHSFPYLYLLFQKQPRFPIHNPPEHQGYLPSVDLFPVHKIPIRLHAVLVICRRLFLEQQLHVADLLLEHIHEIRPVI